MIFCFDSQELGEKKPNKFSFGLTQNDFFCCLNTEPKKKIQGYISVLKVKKSQQGN